MALGIMLSALVLSLVLVPALAALLGRAIWWPTRTARTPRRDRVRGSEGRSERRGTTRAAFTFPDVPSGAELPCCTAQLSNQDSAVGAAWRGVDRATGPGASRRPGVGRQSRHRSHHGSPCSISRRPRRRPARTASASPGPKPPARTRSSKWSTSFHDVGRAVGGDHEVEFLVERVEASRRAAQGLLEVDVPVLEFVVLEPGPHRRTRRRPAATGALRPTARCARSGPRDAGPSLNVPPPKVSGVPRAR